MTAHAPASLEINISRRFDASPEALFRQWLDAEALRDWFAPETYTGVQSTVDARVGGAWMVAYQSASGEHLTEHGVYTEIVPHTRLVMTLNQPFVAGAGELTITVSFEAVSGGTRCTFIRPASSR